MIKNRKEFAILSIVNQNNNVLKSKSKLKILLYLSDTKLNNSIYEYEKGNVGPEPKEIDNILNSLSEKGLLNIKVLTTYGGDKRYKYYLSNKYRNTTADIEQKEYIHNTIGKVCDEYSEIPISNLMNIIRQNHREYFENNPHTWY